MWGGLARAFVQVAYLTPRKICTLAEFGADAPALMIANDCRSQVTVDCVSPNRALVAAIDADKGTTLVAPAAAGKACAGTSIVLQATADGVEAAQVSIPVSSDARTHGVMAVASATAMNFADGFSYVDSFVG